MTNKDMNTLAGNLPGNLVFGVAGMSAYEVAVKNGFQGDVNAWLASLQGPAGPAPTDAQVQQAVNKNLADHPVTITVEVDKNMVATHTPSEIYVKKVGGYQIQARIGSGGLFATHKYYTLFDVSSAKATFIRLDVDDEGYAVIEELTIDSGKNVTLREVEAEAGVLIVTIDSSATIASHSASEIKAALNAGQMVIAKIDDQQLLVYQVHTNYVAFSENVIEESWIARIAYQIADDKTVTMSVTEYTVPDSGGNAALTTAQIEALHGMFKVCAFTKDDVSAEYNAFLTAFGLTDSGDSGEDTHTHSYTSSVTTAATCTTAGVRTYTCSCGESYTESIPATGHNYANGVCTVCGAADPNAGTEKTLSSISATYSGGDVAVGTAVTALTGIVVTAHYSDGSTATVTGYTLSGTIAEGSNTVTVSYGGKTTTFSVTGIAESSGADTGWTANVAYTNYNWTDGYYIRNTDGAMMNYNSSATSSDFMPCDGVSILRSSVGLSYAAFYDSEKNFVAQYKCDVDEHVEVPENAAYFRISAFNSDIKAVVIVPDPDMSVIGTEWEDGVAYTDYNWTADKMIPNNTGSIGNMTGWKASDYMPCAGATSITSSVSLVYAAFYDYNKTYISALSATANTATAVPENAKFFRFSVTNADAEVISIVPNA